MTLTELQELCFKASAQSGWWELKEGQSVDDLVPVKLCLIHSEVSEAMEGHRKDLKADKLPHRDMAEVELADVLIRVLDLAGAMGYDMETTIAEKMDFNAIRDDHKPAVRRAAGGKRY